MATNRRLLNKRLGDSVDQSNSKSESDRNSTLIIETLKLNKEIDIIKTVKSEPSSNNQRQGQSKTDASRECIVKNEGTDTFQSEVADTGRKRKKRNPNKIFDEPDPLFKITDTYTITECSNNSVIDNNVNSNKSDSTFKNNSRKRKIVNYASLINNDDTDEDDNILEKSNQVTVDSKSENVEETVKRKRGRPKGYKMQPKLQPADVVTEEESGECATPKKKGRPRGSFASSNSNHSKLVNLIFQQYNTGSTSNSDISTLDPTDSTNISIKDVSNTVTCAICNLQMVKSTWVYHKYRNHNNVAWRIGEEPLNLKDSSVVMRILTDLYKRKKPLYCENCDVAKKSVIGYLSHKSVCQRSFDEIRATKIQCEHCGRSVMPVSMSIHLKICRRVNTERESEPEEPKDNTPVTGKRRAAAKAESFIRNHREADGNTSNKKRRRTWYVNFDFQPTAKGKLLIQDEINKKESATCWFKECNFESTFLDDMESHISNCKFKPSEGYTCKYCFLTCATEDEAAQHFNQNHSNDEEFECNDTDYDQVQEDMNALDYLDEPKATPSKKNLFNGIQFLLKYRYFSMSSPMFYPPAYEWTLKFCTRNFCLTDVFPQLRINYNDLMRLNPEELSKYLPKQKYSICTASIQETTYTDPLKLDYDWKRYKLFESDLLYDDTSTLFCGGAVTAMAWLPTPYDAENCTQILAVSSNSNFNKGYAIHQLYKEPGLLQFWDFGILNNDNNSLTCKPEMLFCLAHDHSPVWCLEWCPSGCYDKDFQQNSPNRLGLLAVGCADSFIYIYSLYLPDPRSGKIFKLKPVLKLLLNTRIELAVNGIEAHVTKLSWTRAKGHGYLAAGYSNGMIAIFDMNSISSLLNLGSNNDDVKMMLPYQVLNAHYHAITALYLYHLNGGRRWLMSGSLDRTIKYWDLENPFVPISNFTKFIVTDGVWLNNWLTSVHTYEDCCGGGLTPTTIHQLRNYECIGASILHSNSCVPCISGSDWTNSFIQGNEVGEVTGFFPHQLFYYLENDKNFRVKKGVLGYARVVEKDVIVEERLKNEKIKNSRQKGAAKTVMLIGEPQECPRKNKNQEPMNYEEADDKYGLVFCDLIIDSIKDLPANLSDYYKSNTDKFYPTRPHIYPLQCINQVTINPNSKSYCYYATGYQAGFIRISSIKNLNKNSMFKFKT